MQVSKFTKYILKHLYPQISFNNSSKELSAAALRNDCKAYEKVIKNLYICSREVERCLSGRSIFIQVIKKDIKFCVNEVFFFIEFNEIFKICKECIVIQIN